MNVFIQGPGRPRPNNATLVAAAAPSQGYRSGFATIYTYCCLAGDKPVRGQVEGLFSSYITVRQRSRVDYSTTELVGNK